MIIGLNGYAGSGKDTLAKSLILRHDFVRVSFADKLKKVAYGSNPWIRWNEDSGKGQSFIRLRDAVNLHGWEKVKRQTDAREYLQLLGTEGVRDHLGSNAWVTACASEVAAALAQGKNVVFTDMRYPNEFAYIRDLGGYTVRIERPNVQAVNEHQSDVALWGYEFDLLVQNDGTLQQLANKATAMYHRLLDKEARAL